jgi:hypothetical protein
MNPLLIRLGWLGLGWIIFLTDLLGESVLPPFIRACLLFSATVIFVSVGISATMAIWRRHS